MSLKKILQERYANGLSDSLREGFNSAKQKIAALSASALILGVSTAAASDIPQRVPDPAAYSQNDSFPHGPVQQEHSFGDTMHNLFTGTYLRPNEQDGRSAFEINDESSSPYRYYIPNIKHTGGVLTEQKMRLVGEGAENPYIMDHRLRLVKENSSAYFVGQDNQILAKVKSVDGINDRKLLQLSVSPDVLKNKADLQNIVDEVARYAEIEKVSMVVPNSYLSKGISYYDFSRETAQERNIIPVSDSSMQKVPEMFVHKLSDAELKDIGAEKPPAEPSNDVAHETSNLTIDGHKNNDVEAKTDSLVFPKETPLEISQNYKSVGDIHAPNGLTLSDKTDISKFINLKLTDNGTLLEGGLSPAAMADKKVAGKFLDEGTNIALNNNVPVFKMPSYQIEKAGGTYYDMSKLSNGNGSKTIYPVSAEKESALENSVTQKMEKVSADKMDEYGKVNLIRLKAVQAHALTIPKQQEVHLMQLPTEQKPQLMVMNKPEAHLVQLNNVHEKPLVPQEPVHLRELETIHEKPLLPNNDGPKGF